MYHARAIAYKHAQSKKQKATLSRPPSHSHLQRLLDNRLHVLEQRLLLPLVVPQLLLQLRQALRRARAHLRSVFLSSRPSMGPVVLPLLLRTRLAI